METVTEDRAMSRELTRAANGYLAHARQGQFTDQTLLEKALNCFMLALELSRDDIEPYLGLAYVAALVNLYDHALDALTQAARVAPGDPRVPVMRREVHALLRNPALSQYRPPAGLHSLIQQIPFQQLAPELLLATDRALLAMLEASGQPVRPETPEADA